MMLVEPYTQEGTLEGGGLGLLCRCRDARGTPFAAKFPKDHQPANQRMVDDEERRFVRHQGQHVVQYFGRVQLTDGRRGFAMELMDGSLAGLVAKNGALGRKTAVEYFAHAAIGLAEVHGSALGAFHGDIKLGNILHKNGVAKLADFGLARGGAGQTMMLGPHTGGTPGYMPPEGFASPKGDIYSLGVALWAMLAGRELGRDQRPVVGDVPAQLSSLLKRMLEPDPARRCDIGEVLQRLPAVRAECGTPAGNNDWLADALKVLAVVGGIGLLAAGIAAALGSDD